MFPFCISKICPKMCYCGVFNWNKIKPLEFCNSVRNTIPPHMIWFKYFSSASHLDINVSQQPELKTFLATQIWLLCDTGGIMFQQFMFKMKADWGSVASVPYHSCGCSATCWRWPQFFLFNFKWHHIHVCLYASENKLAQN